ncbi:uncharacterized protein [Halyomorpha halys]|uniref:uncharacterized protein n=1 Tax=Halyomorpha halys TaxID=286706 RepID=UPI0006D513B5|nr:uncharacterized protein LOC106687670 [Halyomorpha halys]
MMKLSVVMTLIAGGMLLASAEMQEGVWNNHFDYLVRSVQATLRFKKSSTYYHSNQLHICKKVYAKQPIVTGLDSLMRFGNCNITSDTIQSNVTFKYILRFELFAIAFPKLIVDGVVMSAYMRVKNVIINMSHTLYIQRHPKVKVNEINLIAFSGIEFATSKPEHDVLVKDGEFLIGVAQKISDRLQLMQPMIEDYLTLFYMKLGGYIEPEKDVPQKLA